MNDGMKLRRIIADRLLDRLKLMEVYEEKYRAWELAALRAGLGRVFRS